MLYLTPLYRLHYWLGAPRRVLTNITSYSSALISLIIICLSICCLAREHFTTTGSGHRGKNREIISNFVGAWNGCFYNNMSIQEGQDIRNGDDHEIITETWIYCGNSFFTPVCQCSPVTLLLFVSIAVKWRVIWPPRRRIPLCGHFRPHRSIVL